MNRWTRFLIIILALVVGSLGIEAQTKKQLSRKKKKLEQEISTLVNIRNEIKQNKNRASLRHLITTRTIESRVALIKSINEEIGVLEEEVIQEQAAIDSLEIQLELYRKQYKKMVVYAYKNRNAHNNVVFVFAAENFNDAFKRLKYINKISEYRLHQAKEIKAAQKVVENKIAQLETRKERKKALLGGKYYEKKKLQKDEKENAETIKSLQKDEAKIRKQLIAKERARKKLQAKIEAIIAEEIRKAQEEARKRREALAKQGKKDGDNKNRPKIPLAPPSEKLSKNFANNKKKLPWPVNKGVVSSKFGIRTHHAFKHLKVNNNGIDLLTTKGEQALAVFKGNVVAVIVIPSGNKSAVLVQHGEYFTLYSNLSTVKVARGDKVKTGQKLGTIKTEEGKTDLHFELWKGKVKQNPLLWLKPR